MGTSYSRRFAPNWRQRHKMSLTLPTYSPDSQEHVLKTTTEWRIVTMAGPIITACLSLVNLQSQFPWDENQATLCSRHKSTAFLFIHVQQLNVGIIHNKQA